MGETRHRLNCGRSEKVWRCELARMKGEAFTTIDSSSRCIVLRTNFIIYNDVPTLVPGFEESVNPHGAVQGLVCQDHRRNRDPERLHGACDRLDLRERFQDRVRQEGGDI